MTIPPLLVFAAVLSIIGLIGWLVYRIGVIDARLDKIEGNE